MLYRDDGRLEHFQASFKADGALWPAPEFAPAYSDLVVFRHVQHVEDMGKHCQAQRTASSYYLLWVFNTIVSS